MEGNCEARYSLRKVEKYHEPNFLKNERGVTEERLQNIRGREQGDLRQKIGPQLSGGFHTPFVKWIDQHRPNNILCPDHRQPQRASNNTPQCRWKNARSTPKQTYTRPSWKSPQKIGDAMSG